MVALAGSPQALPSDRYEPVWTSVDDNFEAPPEKISGRIGPAMSAVTVAPENGGTVEKNLVPTGSSNPAGQST